MKSLSLNRLFRGIYPLTVFLLLLIGWTTMGKSEPSSERKLSEAESAILQYEEPHRLSCHALDPATFLRSDACAARSFESRKWQTVSASPASNPFELEAVKPSSL